MLDFFEDFVGFELDLDAIDYNPAGFSSRKRKLAMLNRLLPFVQNNLHLIELAPKGGTGAPL